MYHYGNGNIRKSYNVSSKQYWIFEVFKGPKYFFWHNEIAWRFLRFAKNENNHFFRSEFFIQKSNALESILIENSCVNSLKLGEMYLLFADKIFRKKLTHFWICNITELIASEWIGKSWICALAVLNDFSLVARAITALRCHLCINREKISNV